MSTKRCPTCGHHVDDVLHTTSDLSATGDIELETLTLDGASFSGTQQVADPWIAPLSAGERPETDQGGLVAAFRRRPIIGLFLAAAAVLGGLQLLEVITGRSEPSNVLEEAGPEEVAQPSEPDTTTETGLSSTDQQEVAAEAHSAEVDARVEAFDRAAATGVPSVAPYVVTYRTEEGLVAVTGASAFRSDPKLLALYNEADGFSFLPTNEGTWAVNPEDPTDSFLVSYSSEVVATRRSGRHVYVDTRENGQRIAGVIINGVTGPFHEIPSGSQYLLVPELGVLITPPTGGTVLLESTTIEPFSDARVVAATSDAWIVQRCDASLVCSLNLIDAESGAEVMVPDSGDGPPPFLSPDGALLLYRTDGAEDFIYRVDEDRVWSLQEKIDPLAMWSPDGRVLAWIDGSDLVTVDAANGESTRAQLDVQPIAPSLLITMDPAIAVDSGN